MQGSCMAEEKGTVIRTVEHIFNQYCDGGYGNVILTAMFSKPGVIVIIYNSHHFASVVTVSLFTRYWQFTQTSLVDDALLYP